MAEPLTSGLSGYDVVNCGDAVILHTGDGYAAMQNINKQLSFPASQDGLFVIMDKILPNGFCLSFKQSIAIVRTLYYN